jgi:hypothetical protein
MRRSCRVWRLLKEVLFFFPLICVPTIYMVDCGVMRLYCLKDLFAPWLHGDLSPYFY